MWEEFVNSLPVGGSLEFSPGSPVFSQWKSYLCELIRIIGKKLTNDFAILIFFDIVGIFIIIISYGR